MVSNLINSDVEKIKGSTLFVFHHPEYEYDSLELAVAQSILRHNELHFTLHLPKTDEGNKSVRLTPAYLKWLLNKNGTYHTTTNDTENLAKEFAALGIKTSLIRNPKNKKIYSLTVGPTYLKKVMPVLYKRIFVRFYNKILDVNEPLEPDFVVAVNRNYWNLF